jgi:hypothetical protein
MYITEGPNPFAIGRSPLIGAFLGSAIEWPRHHQKIAVGHGDKVVHDDDPRNLQLCLGSPPSLTSTFLAPPLPDTRLTELAIDGNSLRVDFSVLVDSPQFADDRFGGRSISKNEVCGINFGVLDKLDGTLSISFYSSDIQSKEADVPRRSLHHCSTQS